MKNSYKILSILLSIVYLALGKQNEVAESNHKSQKNWIPKIIWTYWDQKIEDKDHARKLFEFNHKMMQNGWELRHVDKSNASYWLDQIPDFGDKLNYPQFRDYRPYARADLIRMGLIKHFGGVYIDYSTILTQPLDWLLQIGKQTFVQNKYGQQPNLLLLYSYHTQKESYFDRQLNKNALMFPTFQNFFIAGKSGSGFLQQWFTFYAQAKNISQKKYPKGFSHDMSWIVDTSNSQNIKAGGFKNKKYFQVSICAQLVLQRKQKQLDKLWEASNKNGDRPIAIKNYNIWTMYSANIGYQIHTLVRQNSLQTISVIMQSDRFYLQQNGVSAKYFIKLFRPNLQMFLNFLLNQKSVNQINCPENYYIHQNSYGYHYLLKNYPIKFYLNPVVNIQYNRNCATFAQMKILKQIETKKFTYLSTQNYDRILKEKDGLAQQKNQLIQQKDKLNQQKDILIKQKQKLVQQKDNQNKQISKLNQQIRQLKNAKVTQTSENLPNNINNQIKKQMNQKLLQMKQLINNYKNKYEQQNQRNHKLLIKLAQNIQKNNEDIKLIARNDSETLFMISQQLKKPKNSINLSTYIILSVILIIIFVVVSIILAIVINTKKPQPRHRNMHWNQLNKNQSQNAIIRNANF